MNPDYHNSQGLRNRVVWTVLLLGLFFLLYLLRAHDDSRLSGWQDVFSVANPLKTALLLFVALAAAFILSLTRAIERRPALLLFLLSFGAAACFWSEPELIVDASRYVTQAKHLELYGIRYFFHEWGAAINAWTDLPLVPFLYGMLFSLFGEERLVIQVFNTLLFSSTVLLTYLTGKELWNREVGLYGGIFLLGIPYLYTQVPLMLADVPSMFFFMLSVFAFILALRRGGVQIAAAALVLFAAFFTKYSLWLMLTVIPIIYAVELFNHRKEGLDRYALRGMIVFFVSFFLISVFVAFHHDVMMQQIHLLLTFQRPGLSRWGESFASIFLFQVHPVVAILAAVSVYFAVKKRDLSCLIIAWLVLLMLVLQVRRVRYLVAAFPMLCLMASYGLMKAKRYLDPAFTALSTAASSFVIASAAFLPFQQGLSAENFRDAARYLDSLGLQEVEVYTPLPDAYVMNPPVSVPILDLFLRTEIRYRYHEADYPLPEDYETSPLRFTWTYRNPPYYEGNERHGKKAAVVITDRAGEDLPALQQLAVKGYVNRRIFGQRDDVYQHQTLITVYY
jgi:hypothetical protein